MVGDSNKKTLAVVYYRDIPVALDIYIKKAQRISYVKDGVQKFNGISSPRITLLLEEKDPNSDKILVSDLDDMLNELSSNNQIVAYIILKKL